MITFIGNAHIDPAWMWQTNEGYDAFASTARSALARIDENDDIFFCASSASLYEFIERTDPDLFSQIQQSVADGKWEIVGGWWVEPDCNLPSGESFIRHSLIAQRYFKDKFNVECRIGYCIDSFGHNGNLPQLLRIGGMQYYVFMRPASDELTLPSPLYIWSSRSGDKVLAYRIPFHYSNYLHSSEEKVALLRNEQYFDQSREWMLFYGVGNHGGGPTKEQIRSIKSLRQTDDFIRFGRIDDYFRSVESNTDLPVIRSDIQRHAIGCYSAHSQIKQLNRLAEIALIRAEKIAALCEINGIDPIDWKRITDGWKRLLFNQFHDILGGVAVPSAMNTAVRQLSESIQIAEDEAQIAVHRLAANYQTAEGGESLLIVNPHPYRLTSPIDFELWHPDASEKRIFLNDVSLADSIGNSYHTQIVRSEGNIGGDRVGCAAFIPLDPGINLFLIHRHKITSADNPFFINEQRISNGRISFGIGLTDADFLYFPPAVYRDSSDTWGHGVSAFSELIGEFQIVKTQIIESGPLRVCLRITSVFGTSQIIEDVYMYAGSDLIESNVRMFIVEKNIVIKLRFAHLIDSPVFITEIPYSFEERPSDGTEWYGHTYSIVQGAHSSLTLINDAKYSYSCDSTFLYLTAARTVRAAYHHPPHPADDDLIEEYLDLGEQSFRYVLSRHIPSPSDASQTSAKWLVKPYVLYRSGTMTDKPTLPIRLEPSENVLLETVKKSENDDGWIFRFRETSGKVSDCLLQIGRQDSYRFSLNPYEICTYRLKNDDFRLTDGLEQSF